MNQAEAIQEIKKALELVLRKEATISRSTHLIEDGIVDSLDGIKFVFELEGKLSIQLPEGDLEEIGLYEVGNLADFLAQSVGKGGS